MKRWKCIVCNWVYEEAKGWPKDRIQAGTRWEDIPEHWLCPYCGVGKEDFEMIDAGPAPADVPHHSEEVLAHRRPVVIIGTGLAGTGVAREFRKYDSDTPLILITADDGRIYSKPMLSTGFTKQTTADSLVSMDAGQLAMQLKASVWTHTEVTAVDTDKQIIRFGDTGQVGYGKLVIALGADVIRPPLAGNGLDRVYSINSRLDYADFRQALENSHVKKLVIIGAGLIGSEFANDLSNGGYELEAVDPLAYSLPTLLPEVAGKAVQAALEEKGVKFHFGALVTEVNKKPDDTGVIVSLNSGQQIDADLVVCAVGVRPSLTLAKQAGLQVNRGIVANRFLETSARNVYTLGDCAEVEGHVLFFVAPLVAAAHALGKTLAGNSTAVAYPAMPVTIKTPACPVVVSPPPRGAEGAWHIEATGKDIVAQFRDRQGNLLGFALTGAGTAQKTTLQKQLPPMLV